MGAFSREIVHAISITSNTRPIVDEHGASRRRRARGEARQGEKQELRVGAKHELPACMHGSGSHPVSPPARAKGPHHRKPQWMQMHQHIPSYFRHCMDTCEETVLWLLKQIPKEDALRAHGDPHLLIIQQSMIIGEASHTNCTPKRAIYSVLMLCRGALQPERVDSSGKPSKDTQHCFRRTSASTRTQKLLARPFCPHAPDTPTHRTQEQQTDQARSLHAECGARRRTPRLQASGGAEPQAHCSLLKESSHTEHACDQA
jgi:hypothetical protein